MQINAKGEEAREIKAKAEAKAKDTDYADLG